MYMFTITTEHAIIFPNLSHRRRWYMGPAPIQYKDVILPV